MNKHKLEWMKQRLQEFGLVFAIAIIALAALLPVLISRQASAAGQLASRSLAINSGVPGKTGVQYKFTFTVVATSTLQSLKFEACTTAVGACSTPTGLNFASATYVSQNNWQGAVNFAVGAGTGDCTAGARVICATRSSATNQTATSRDITFGTITNPTTANSSFFVRISTYSDASYTLANIQDYGVTASAVTATLTTSAQVSEVLNFCVGSTAVNDAETITTLPTSCAGVTGTSVNLGVLSTGGVNVSPVQTTNGGDNFNGLVMLRTNSTNGTTVSYHGIQASTGTNHLGTLRISGATCDAADPSSSTTDGCINSAGWTGSTASLAAVNLVSGTEKFGMTIAGVSCDSTTSYSCTFSGTPAFPNLTRDAEYNGDGTTSNVTNFTDLDVVAGTTTNQYAWNESTTVFDQIASSTTYVDDESLILKFAATASLITPFGSYTVDSDFVAVTTY